MVVAAEKEREFEWRDKEFKFLAELMYEKTGIVLTERKREMLYGRLVRRLRALKLNHFSDYCAYLQGPKGDKEIGFTLNAVTTNTTNFFREMHHFDYLRDKILTPLSSQISRNPRHRFRIWSAGCSSGEEPYSIAMMIRNILGNRVQDCKILATDLDSNVINKALTGHYDAERCLKTIPKIYLKSGMTKVRGSQDTMLEVAENVRKLITFKQLNLLHTWPMKGKFDVIFCRNVMIYFDRETQERLVRNFAKYLKPEGVLFVGHSENLLSVSDIFKCEGQTTYRMHR